jgi:adenosylhomocysteine nucleosidase
VTAARERHILVVTAVKAETRAVLAAMAGTTRAAIPGFPAWRGRTGARVVTVVQSGIGPTLAAAALTAATSAYDVVVSLGFAGALTDAVGPRDVVMPETVVWEEPQGVRLHTIHPPTWRATRACVAGDSDLRVHTGRLLSSPVIIGSPGSKRAAAARTGAIAVEMETAALVQVAAARDVPVLALRVVLDGADVSLDSVPPDLSTSWGARARLIARPRAWPIVAQLARELPRASHALTRAAALALPAA